MGNAMEMIDPVKLARGHVARQFAKQMEDVLQLSRNQAHRLAFEAETLLKTYTESLEQRTADALKLAQDALAVTPGARIEPSAKESEWARRTGSLSQER